jgi:hypothetical protein
MKDPERLSAGSDFGAKLLGSARLDAPSAGTRARVAAGVGIGVTAATVTAGGTASAGAAAAKAGATALWLKVVAGGIVTAAIAGGTVAIVRDNGKPAEVAPPPAATGPVRSVIAPKATSARVAEPEREPVPDPAPPPASTAPPKVESKPRSPASAAVVVAERSAPAESGLARELRMLDTARSALAKGDAAGSITALDQYDRAFPAGSLHTESAMLRVEALLAKGDRTGAQKLAHELLAKDPTGPQARRLQTIAGEPEVK